MGTGQGSRSKKHGSCRFVHNIWHSHPNFCCCGTPLPTRKCFGVCSWAVFPAHSNLTYFAMGVLVRPNNPDPASGTESPRSNAYTGCPQKHPDPQSSEPLSGSGHALGPTSPAG